MTDNKNNRNDLHGPDPFISQNVWLKRLGLLILLCGLFPAVYIAHKGILVTIGMVVIILAIVTYFIKQLKDFFKSLWNS